MIVLLNCSINLSASNLSNNDISSTGEGATSNDSVLVAYKDLKLANSKLIQLDYEKQINNNLRNIIYNDSIIIKNYKEVNDRISKDCKKAIIQRNIAIGSTLIFIVTTIILCFK